MSSEGDDLSRWNDFLGFFRQAVINPSSERPAVRCWTRPALTSLIADIKERHLSTLNSTFPPAREVICRMEEEIGWVRRLPLEEAPGRGAPELFLIDMEAAPGEMPDPLEVLQGCEPKGVLCYFGVVAFHELTTQRPPFYHVARFQKPPRVSPVRVAVSPPSGSRGKERSPQGTCLFGYQGASCYLTRRVETLVPGVQTRICGSRIWLRMTTLEQTLLDTLQYPLQCGGEDVAFEAWERGAARCDWDRMAEHLARLQLPELDRRVGAMLDTMKVEPDSAALNGRLAAVRGLAVDPVPLLKKFPYARLDARWQVLIP